MIRLLMLRMCVHGIGSVKIEFHVHRDIITVFWDVENVTVMIKIIAEFQFSSIARTFHSTYLMIDYLKLIVVHTNDVTNILQRSN